MSEPRCRRKIGVMVGTELSTQGGISSVVAVYQQAGLFERYPLTYLASHCDGGAARKLRVFAAAWLRFIVELAGQRVALCHLHTASRASFWRKACFALPAFLFRVPVILHLHGAEFAQFYENENGPMRRRFIRWMFARSARVIALSDSWRTWLLAMCPAAKVHALYNPVSASTAERRNRKGRSVLFLGRLGQRKGTYDLIAALPPLVAAHPDLEIVLGGDGELEAVRAQVAAAGLSANVRVPGWIRGEAKQQLLATATTYVLPSYNEGLPMSVLEAMAAGLAVVTTPVGGIPEAISDGREGFLVPPGDVAMLSSRLRTLLDDPALATRMGEAGRQKIDALFSTGVVLPRLEMIYQAVGLHPRGTPA